MSLWWIEDSLTLQLFLFVSLFSMIFCLRSYAEIHEDTRILYVFSGISSSLSSCVLIVIEFWLLYVVLRWQRCLNLELILFMRWLTNFSILHLWTFLLCAIVSMSNLVMSGMIVWIFFIIFSRIITMKAWKLDSVHVVWNFIFSSVLIVLEFQILYIAIRWYRCLNLEMPFWLIMTWPTSFSTLLPWTFLVCDGFDIELSYVRGWLFWNFSVLFSLKNYCATHILYISRVVSFSLAS